MEVAKVEADLKEEVVQGSVDVTGRGRTIASRHRAWGLGGLSRGLTTVVGLEAWSEPGCN